MPSVNLISPVGMATVVLVAGFMAACPAVAFQEENKKSVTTAPLPAPVAEFFPAPSDTEVKIQELLRRPVELNLNDTPIRSALGLIKDVQGLPIIVDVAALQAEKVDPNTPVTIQVSGISLRSALNLLLDDLKLAYYVEDDVFKITTRAALAKKLVTRVYPVRELCRTSADFDILAEAIAKTVTPIAWAENGGDCRLVPVVNSGAIVIRATHPMHSDILRLLRTLREARGRAAESVK